MYNLLYFISTVLSIYSVLCFARIIISWFPPIEYSAVGRILCKICDPYLNLFRRLKFLRIGFLDFSVVVALIALGFLTEFTASLASHNTTLSVGLLLANILQALWHIISYILFIFIVFLIIRFIALIFSAGSSYVWSSIDSSVSPILNRITSLFTGGKQIKYSIKLLIGALTLFIFRFALGYLMGIIYNLLKSLPF